MNEEPKQINIVPQLLLCAECECGERLWLSNASVVARFVSTPNACIEIAQPCACGTKVRLVQPKQPEPKRIVVPSPRVVSSRGLARK